MPDGAAKKKKKKPITLKRFMQSEFLKQKSMSLLSPVLSSVTQSCLTLCNPMDCSTTRLLSITNSQRLLKLMLIESVMPSNHLILCSLPLKKDILKVHPSTPTYTAVLVLQSPLPGTQVQQSDFGEAWQGSGGHSGEMQDTFPAWGGERWRGSGRMDLQACQNQLGPDFTPPTGLLSHTKVS